MTAKKSGLKLLIDYLEKRGLPALAALQVLFSLHEADNPMMVIDIFGTGSGYRREQLRTMEMIGLLRSRHSTYQRRANRIQSSPSAYELTGQGRSLVVRFMSRESPDIDDRGHLLRWLKLIRYQGITDFAHLRLLVQIDETPGRIRRELFSYLSGSQKVLFTRLQKHQLVTEVLVGNRKEKYPGPNWHILCCYLNQPIPESLLPK